MKSKLGRPKLPKNEARHVLIGARFTPDEAKELEGSLNKSKQNKSEWVRDMATFQKRVPPVWVNSKWTQDDLDAKRVEFKLTHPRFWVEGVGKFLVRKNAKGELAIDICVLNMESPVKIVETRYYLYQKTADKIERHPDPKVAEFRLKA